MTIINDFLKEDIRIPSPPSIAVRILDAVKKDETSFNELANIITSDPALVAKILMVANSSFYNIPRKIDSIPKALGILGTNTLKNIALSFVIAKDLRGPAEGSFDFDFFGKGPSRPRLVPIFCHPLFHIKMQTHLFQPFSRILVS